MRIALAGVGGAGLHAHVPALREVAPAMGAELVAAADPDARCRAAARAHLIGVRVFECAEQMLDAARADLLVVATDPGAHAKLAARALGDGVHVLCEKPLAVTRSDYVLVTRACDRQRNLALAPVHQYRYAPPWRVLSRWARLADRAKLPFRLIVDVERDGTDRTAVSAWRSDFGHSGGMLADHGVHFLALAWTVSRRIEVLAASRTWQARSRERASATLRLGSGLLQLRVAADADGRHTRVALRLPGLNLAWEDGTARLDVAGRCFARREVHALSDRRLVNELYVPLYRDVLTNLRDPSWRRRRTAESLGVGAVLLALLKATAEA